MDRRNLYYPRPLPWRRSGVEDNTTSQLFRCRWKEAMQFMFWRCFLHSKKHIIAREKAREKAAEDDPVYLHGAREEAGEEELKPTAVYLGCTIVSYRAETL